MQLGLTDRVRIHVRAYTCNMRRVLTRWRGYVTYLIQYSGQRADGVLYVADSVEREKEARKVLTGGGAGVDVYKRGGQEMMGCGVRWVHPMRRPGVVRAW